MAFFRLAAAMALALVLVGGAEAADTTLMMTPTPASTATQKPAPTPVVATGPKLTAAERCTSLEQQFTAALVAHGDAKKLSSAKRLGEEGSEDCAKKKYSLGSRRLVAALADLGVTAKL